MDRIKPLKKFGQNYLTDKNILKKIADEVSPTPHDVIVEIGAGTGALTEFLYQENKSITAVEIDTRVTEELKARFPGITVLQEDVLKTEFNKIFKQADSGKIRIAGNIPYNITSPILFKIFRNSSIISDAVFLVQHEVALRMTAERGTKDYGILAVLLKYFAEVKYCFKVSPNVFFPRPKVSSAVVHIYIRKEFNPGDDDLFIRIVKAAFGKRRKTLKNSLASSIFADLNFQNSGVDLKKRAEELEINDFIKLRDFVRSESGSIDMTYN